MSKRRKARAAVEQTTAAGVPAALVSPDDPIWQDAHGVEVLAEHHRLDYVDPGYSDEGLRDPSLERFKAFRAAYAQSRGLMNERWPWLVDYGRLRAAGIWHIGGRSPRHNR